LPAPAPAGAPAGPPAAAAGGLTRGWRSALSAIVTTACVSCAGPGGGSLATTSVEPASPPYPTVASGCTCAVAAAAARWFQRVLIVVLENQDYETAIANPYLARLAREGALLINYHAQFHPSYPNYLAMVAGKASVADSDRQQDLDECTIADLLQSKGLTWKAYAQGYPAQSDASGHSEQCISSNAVGNYARKHVPFMSFMPIRRHQCGNIVAASQFDHDAERGQLPNYAFYTPDLNNDGHDTSLSFAAAWLGGFLEPLLRAPELMKGTLIVVTFDESGHRSPALANHIYTVFLGPMVKAHRVEDNDNHYNLLRTIEDNFGLCALAAGDHGAQPITSVWK
jgi:hypothetical protein